MIHSFLLLGQSNMAGRGFPDEVAPIENARLKVLRNGRWHPMYTPVNCDRSFSGVNLAESFADLYSKEHNVDVGLIPCADGGTNIDQWCAGGLLYDHAIYQAKLALRTSTIAGVLWHQGESDCRSDRHPYYAEKLQAVLDAFRRDLDLYDVPFLLGGLGDFLPNAGKFELENYSIINRALESTAANRPMTGYVTAIGLTSNPDHLHFNARSLREFGLRYYRIFKTIENTDKVFLGKHDEVAVVRSEIEML